MKNAMQLKAIIKNIAKEKGSIIFLMGLAPKCFKLSSPCRHP